MLGKEAEPGFSSRRSQRDLLTPEPRAEVSGGADVLLGDLYLVPTPPEEGGEIVESAADLTAPKPLSNVRRVKDLVQHRGSFSGGPPLQSLETMRSDALRAVRHLLAGAGDAGYPSSKLRIIANSP